MFCIYFAKYLWGKSKHVVTITLENMSSFNFTRYGNCVIRASLKEKNGI